MRSLAKKSESATAVEYAHGYHEGILVGEYDKRKSQLGAATSRINERLEEVHIYRDSEWAGRSMAKYHARGQTLEQNARKLRARSLGWLRGYREEVLS